MVNETTKTQRILMAVVAVIGGLYLMLWAPTQAMQTLKVSLDQVLLRLVPHDADFYRCARPFGHFLGVDYRLCFRWRIFVDAVEEVVRRCKVGARRRVGHVCHPFGWRDDHAHPMVCVSAG